MGQVTDQVPYCPPKWACDFTPPSVPKHVFDPWWSGGNGAIFAATIVVIAIVVIIVVIAMSIGEAIQNRSDNKLALSKEREQHEDNRELRAQKLAIEEQRTMQIEAAHGNPEILKLIKEMEHG